MPAIKGDMYINTYCNYSQPTLIKLYNENIGGHLTPLQPATRRRRLEVCGLQKSVRLRTQVDRDQDAKMDGLVYIHSTIR